MTRKETIVTRVVHAFAFNAPLSIIVLLGVIVFGSLGYALMPKQYNPEIVRPAFVVVAEYPGARADEVERLVTRELVEKINDIRGVDEITAQSIDGGRAIVSVAFEVGEDVEKAKVSLYTRLMQSAPLAVGAMQQPLVYTVTPDDVPILTFAFSSGTLNQHEVREKVVGVMRELQRVPDVSNLVVLGGSERALRIQLLPEALRARGLSAAEVVGAITRANTRSLGGVLHDGDEVVVLDVDGTLQGADDARSLVVAPKVELSDVALVEDSWREISSFTLLAQTAGGDVHDAVYLSIAKRPGANAPSVSESVHTSLVEILSHTEYSDISYTVIRDDGAVAKNEIQSLGINLVTSILIVGLVLVLFLSYRPALVVMSAIPLTLLLVFFVAFLAGETVNRITLFALILSLGLLVDSATVVVENIYRHIRGRDAQERDIAVVHAVEEVGMSLVLSTVTSVVVFLPVSYITGMMGPYMAPLAFFVPMALIMSLFVAFVMTPFLSYRLLHAESEHGGGVLAPYFERVELAYERLLRHVLYTAPLQKKIVSSVLVLLGLSFTLPLLGVVHFQMLPRADKDQYYIYIDLPERADVVATRAITEEVVRAVREDRAVDMVQVFVGEAPDPDFNGLFKGVSFRNGSHLATVRVNLIPADERSTSSSDSVAALRSRLSFMGVLTPGVSVRVLEDPPGPPVMATFVAKVFGPDDTVREMLASEVLRHTQEIQGIVDADTSIHDAAPRLIIDIDEERVRAYGVSAAAVSESVQLFFGPLDISQYHIRATQEYAPIVVSLSRDERVTSETLDRVDVRAHDGTLVPLSSVVTYHWSRVVPSVYTEDHEQVTYVTAETQDRSIVYVTIDAIRALKNMTSNELTFDSWDLLGMTFRAADGAVYRIVWGGEWEMTLENFRDLGLAMVVALFLVYGILVAQYRSFLVPALVLSTVPFGLVGILIGFAFLDTFFGVYLTATALIGFIALIGIVVNNAIVYLEYFDELRASGSVDVREALIAAGKIRLRPIVLTSLTTVLGSLTIASDPVWSGLAWAIVLGLSLSTALTLVLFPILYVRTHAV